MLVKTRLYVGFLTIALLGLITAGSSFIFFSRLGDAGIELGFNKAPLVDAAMEVKLNAVQANLMFEKIMNGQSGASINMVRGLIDESLWYARAIRDGGSNGEGVFIPSGDDIINGKIDEVIEALDSFREATESRYTQKENAASSGSDADQEFDALYSSLIEKMDRVADAFEGAGDIRAVGTIQNDRFLLADSHLYLEEFLSGDETVTLEEVIAGFEKVLAELTGLRDRYGSALTPLVEDLSALIEAARVRGNNYLSSRDTTEKAVVSYGQSYRVLMDTADEVEEMVHDLMGHYGERFLVSLKRGNLFVILISVITLIITFFLALRFSRSIADPLGGFRDLFVQGSSGDLRMRSSYEGADELGDMGKSFNDFMSRLEGIVITLKKEASSLEEAGAELSAGSREADEVTQVFDTEISRSRSQADQQAANVTETAAAVEQMARNIESLDGIVDEQVASVTESSASIEEMIASVNSIAESSRKAMDQVENLKAQSDKGQQMMSQSVQLVRNVDEMSRHLDEANKVIAGIAAQTNLLAMNAAIEAAHAGDAGRGFSVVADEIRKLAEQSTAQSREVKSSLKEIVSAIERVVDMSRETDGVLKTVNEGVLSMADIFSELHLGLDQQQTSGSTVLAELKRMNDMSQTVRNGSSEMNAGNREIVKAVEELDEGTLRFTESFREIEDQKNRIIEAFKSISLASDNTKGVVKSVNDIASEFITSSGKGANN